MRILPDKAGHAGFKESQDDEEKDKQGAAKRGHDKPSIVPGSALQGLDLRFELLDLALHPGHVDADLPEAVLQGIVGELVRIYMASLNERCDGVQQLFRFLVHPVHAVLQILPRDKISPLSLFERDTYRSGRQFLGSILGTGGAASEPDADCRRTIVPGVCLAGYPVQTEAEIDCLRSPGSYPSFPGPALSRRESGNIGRKNLFISR